LNYEGGQGVEQVTHFLIGLLVLVGLIAFAFGSAVAIGFVRACLLLIAAVVLFGIAYVVIDVMQTPDALPMAKIPEFTPELRRTCREWLDHPNDAPRMCFAYLDRWEKIR
jgi:hypothetical protein